MSRKSLHTRSKAVIGLDLGTSAAKCVIVSKGHILGSATTAIDVLNPQPGWSEQDPAAWLLAARRSVREAVSNSGIAAEDIVAIGLSGQMHGAVALDHSGTPLRPAILWNDNRSVAECSALATALPNIGDVAGIGPMPGFTAPKLMWMRHHEPELYGAIQTVMLPKDYLALWLSGNISTDLSDAAGTMWLDQRERRWSVELAEASGIEMAWLPSLYNGFEQIGCLREVVADELGLPKDIAVMAGGGDAATGSLSMGAAKAGRCLMSLGTSGQLLVVDDCYKPKPKKFVHAFCHTLPDTWFRMAAMLNGARPLAWFAQVLGNSVEEMLALSTEADPERIPLFLPYLTGERSPHGDPNIRGCFYGLEDASGAAEMSRAVVEAVAFSMGDAAESFGVGFAPDSPVPVIGGGSRSDIVLQALADVLGQPVARSEAGEGGAAFGAALLAEVGRGIRSIEALSFEPPVSFVVAPEGNVALLQRFARYRSLYNALKPFADPGASE